MSIVFKPLKNWNTYQVSVIGPGAEFHEAGLLVEGKVLDVNLAEGLVNGRRLPRDLARVVEDGLGHYGHLVVAVGAAKTTHIISFMRCTDALGRIRRHERVTQSVRAGGWQTSIFYSDQLYDVGSEPCYKSQKCRLNSSWIFWRTLKNVFSRRKFTI
jgi:hypothetical protein